MRTIHPILLAKKIPFTLSHRLHVICHKSLNDISPRIGRHNKERLTTSLHVCAIRSPATGARHRRRICKSSLLKWKHWPSTEGGAHGPRRKNRCDFFRLVLRSVSEINVKVFLKRKQNFFKRKCFYLENICETKVF